MRSTSPQKRFVICGFAGFCSAAAQVFSFSQNFLGGHLLKHREILSCCHQQSCKVPFQEGIFRRIFSLEETLIRIREKFCKRTFCRFFSWHIVKDMRRGEDTTFPLHTNCFSPVCDIAQSKNTEKYVLLKNAKKSQKNGLPFSRNQPNKMGAPDFLVVKPPN